ncbi:carbon storage regulator [Pseudomonas alloputida]|uniref:Translational regulator CsrA n=2 Tax=Gammaproteobacteria TaxID=1236 RepID=A0AAW7HIR7_9PSED|nr:MULTISPECIES: carbon storage regulator [Pseudomonas]MCE0862340.1 carbon storage regulator [Pseudomonas alloputida]MCE0891567.1 carbon storage regulator [Pseudomonas alloputida]MCE0920688.1 carbon storage regulator [Pseudomonas alloputida]MCE1047150.1 carbon storage regulator [Pseudomonas alloputida]MCE1127541.1 carbon storage regulator [Pseudomonas alloputida]
MLMLSRNIGKAVIIGGNIRVSVAQVNGCQVRLGIEAPRGVIVDREEIHARRVAEGTVDEAPAFSIDEHVKLAADARRYRWLRDRERIEDPDEDLLVVRGDNWLSGEELDQEIDTALRVQAMQQQVVQESQVVQEQHQ